LRAWDARILLIEQRREPLRNARRQPQSRESVGHFEFQVNGVGQVGGRQKAFRNLTAEREGFNAVLRPSGERNDSRGQRLGPEHGYPDLCQKVRSALAWRSGEPNKAG